MGVIETINSVVALGWSIPWSSLFLLVGLTYGLYLLWRVHSGQSKFALDDLLIDHKTNRADINKLTVTVFAILSIWTVVIVVQAGKDVETLLLGILGIFVGARTANAIFAPKVPPENTTETETKITTKTVEPVAGVPVEVKGGENAESKVQPYGG